MSLNRTIWILGLALASGVCHSQGLINIDYSANHPLTTRARFAANSGPYPTNDDRGTQPICVSRSGSITVSFKWKVPDPMFPLSVYFRAGTTATFTEGNGTVHRLTGPGYNQLVYLSFGATHTMTVTYTGLPNYVTKGSLLMDVFIRDGFAADYWGESRTLYIVDSAPTGIMSEPWTEVLDRACVWARGSSAGAVADAATLGMYFSQEFAYNPSIVPAWWYGKSVSGFFCPDTGFHLGKLVGSGSGFKYADCKDVSTFLHIVLASLGRSSSLKLLWTGVEFLGEPLEFVTNRLCGIGSDPDGDPLATPPKPFDAHYRRYPFTHHQVLEVEGKIYDVAAAQLRNLSGASYGNPPLGWALSGYWQTYLAPLDVVGLTLRYVNPFLTYEENCALTEPQTVSLTTVPVTLSEITGELNP